jgi:hypothetical protein
MKRSNPPDPNRAHLATRHGARRTQERDGQNQLANGATAAKAVNAGYAVGSNRIHAP